MTKKKKKNKNQKPFPKKQFITAYVILITLTIICLPFLMFLKQISPRTYLFGKEKKLYNNDQNIKLEITYYESPDVIATLQSSTTDLFHINEEKLKKINVSETTLIKDDATQSDFIIAGDAQHGTYIQNNQLYAFVENTASNMVGCYIIRGEKEAADEYKIYPTSDLIKKLEQTDSRKVTYEGLIKQDEEYSLFCITTDDTHLTYLYVSNKTHRIKRSIRIEDKTIQVTDVSELNEEVTFFKNMETFNAFNLITKADFDSIYKQFAFYALSTSSLTDDKK